MRIWESFLLILLGWAFSELSQLLRRKHDDRQAIAKALSILLEVRHRVFSNHFLTQFVSALPPDEAMHAKKVVDRFDELHGDLSEKYSDAVELLSGSEPVLAYSLRQQDVILPMLKEISHAKSITPGMETIELSKMAARNLSTAILMLAKAHSWRTWKEVRRLIRESPNVVKKEFEELMEQIRS